MPRFLVSSKDRQGSRLILRDKKIIHHARDVLRLKVGQGVTAVDEQGNLFECRIEDLSAGAVLKITKQASLCDAERIRVAVACAIPKKAKMDDIVDKLTQLGVEEIIPFFQSA